jgi:ubiquinone/menaquinone biosynthesis C-methylase UbiE
VGFYSEVIFPRLCDFGLDRPFVAEQRQHALTSARGNVLEIGFGTGLNLPHYPTSVRKLTTVDPNAGMNRRAAQRIRQSKVEVECHQLMGERLPFADASFDTVVSTFTLCSIPNVSAALAELHRVLKPSSLFLFLEHGLSPEPSVQKWQRRLNGLERWFADGCHLDRNIRQLIDQQPFSSVVCEAFSLEQVPKTHGYIYRGSATK